MVHLADQQVLAADQGVTLGHGEVQAGGPLRHLLFQRLVGQPQGGIGVFQLFRGDLKLLQGNLQFLVQDRYLALQPCLGRRAFRPTDTWASR